MRYDPVPSSFVRRPVAINAEVSAFLFATYRWMACGLGLTGLTAWFVASTPALSHAIIGNPIVFYGLMIAQFAMVVVFTRKVAEASAPAAAGMFLGYSFLNGLTLSVIFMAYAQATIAQAFFVSAGAFGALSVYGMVTKRDLTPVGQFMFIGLVGLMLAMVVNMFVHSSAISFISSCAGVLIFAGLTAYDNQRLKHMYMMTSGAGNLAIHGALTLYLDFINMFLFILRLFGNRR